MIAIINITEEPTTTGPNLYSLQINNNRLCTFIHNREEGLDACLESAIIAYKKENEKCKEEKLKYIIDNWDLLFEGKC